MFKKIILSISLIILFIPVQSVAQANPISKMKAAFIRNDDLWIKTGHKEHRITSGEYIRYPKWSHDGNWIAYLKSKNSSFHNGELWLYNLNMEKHFMVKEGVYNNFQWAPGQNKMGFLVNQELFVLNTEPSKHFLVTQLTKNIANFSWLPNGSGFLTSAKENKQLNSDIILSTILLRSDRQKPVFKHFYTIPVGENEIVVGTSQFKWSHNHKWISFILNPSASLSADNNTLCLIAADGQFFQRVDEMLDYLEWLQWAPTKSFLGYIGGFGREANINKQGKLVRAPSFHNELFTPKGYVDRDLYWKNDRTIYVSRSKEIKQADLDKRPLPSLYEIDISTFRNKQLTNPAKHEGDFAPQFFHSQLLWVRTDTQAANIFVSRTDNMKEIAWIKNLTVASAYYSKWQWEEVFSLYNGKEV